MDRIRRPNSPLLPLSPLVTNGKPVNKKKFLSPSDVKSRRQLRRSFTPIGGSEHLFVSPLSISPIFASNKKKSNGTPKSPKSPKSPKKIKLSEKGDDDAITKTATQSMKKIRYSVRFVLIFASIYHVVFFFL